MLTAETKYVMHDLNMPMKDWAELFDMPVDELLEHSDQMSDETFRRKMEKLFSKATDNAIREAVDFEPDELDDFDEDEDLPDSLVIEPWSILTDADIREIKKEKCINCPYRSGGAKLKYFDEMTCDYSTITGHIRGGDPRECTHYLDKIDKKDRAYKFGRQRKA